MPLRKLSVNMDEILDAIDTYGDVPDAYLDVETGRVEYWVDPMDSGEEPVFDREEERWVEIPRRESRDSYRAMELFVESLDEEYEMDAQRELRIALGGSGGFRRFRDVITCYPDLRTRWETEKQDRLLELALSWFRELAIVPQYKLRKAVPPKPKGHPTPTRANVRIGLFDLLLLGAPDGKTELLEGRVRRMFVASNAEQARKVFASIARELAEHEGLGWRKALIEDRNDFSAGRNHLSVDGRMVHLDVEIPRVIWDAFAEGP